MMSGSCFQSKDQEPVVLVRCMTYNHENYIVDALNGFVLQKTNFPFIAVIINDASTDSTMQRINDFISSNCLSDHTVIEEIYGTIIDARSIVNHNCRLYVIDLKENHFGKKDKYPYYAHLEDKVKYIAMCEGDDYWTDPLKLQMQVDILEADGTLMAVVSDTSIVDKQGNTLNSKRGGVVNNDVEGRYTLRDFFKYNHQYPTASIVFRNKHKEAVKAKHAHTRNIYLGDWTLWICLHIFGDFYFLNKVTTAYRINPTSITHTCDRIGRAKANWTICESVADILPEEYADLSMSLRKNDWAWISLMFAYKHEKKYFRMLGCTIIALIKCPKALWEKWINRKRKSQL